MSLQLIVEPEAESDIFEGYLWYEERQHELGSKFLEEIESCFDRIVENPRLYEEVEVGIRRSVTHTFPWLVFYASDEQAIHILAVIFAAQDPAYIASRLDT
jgi:plasmid stabilization system protein ParE